MIGTCNEFISQSPWSNGLRIYNKSNVDLRFMIVAEAQNNNYTGQKLNGC